MLQLGQNKLSGFNPRTREGCDSLRLLDIQRNKCFNPRTREGCDGNAGRR